MEKKKMIYEDTNMKVLKGQKLSLIETSMVTSAQW